MHSKIFFSNRRDFLRTTAATLAAGSLPAFPTAPFAAAENFATRLSSLPAKPQRIIIDTDPGVDDAMAIFLALRSPELKVEAITAVSGNVPLAFTLPNALRLVEIAGHPEIPVAGGAAFPLVRRLVTAAYVHGNNGLGGVEFPEAKIKPVPETASELIRRIVRANPGEITIAAVGPLTNIATVLKADPGIAKLIKSFALMGGSLSGGNITPVAEFNFYVDPEAARVVFDSGVPIVMVGLDVTHKVLLRESHVRTLEAAQNPVSQAAAKIMRATLGRVAKTNDETVVAMHDPLTIASLIDPSVITLRDYYVQIETSGELTAGQSVGYSHAPVRRSPPLDTGDAAGAIPVEEFKPNCKVAVGVDPDKFFNLLIPRLTASA
ncbi:MAG TPA: nucleoside hydrolase [Candidatus Limnocylindrales bacterium]|nr:nucleoside hydrolase [Candidatus Limnocylindrales bacterium]